MRSGARRNFIPQIRGKPTSPSLLRTAMPADRIKVHGIHYTPPELAGFLAEATVEHCPRDRENLRVLDPACGDGALLHAFVLALPAPARKRLTLVGFETDAQALGAARRLLARCDVADVNLHNADFLASGVEATRRGQMRDCSRENDSDTDWTYDAIISNPPYVRTQVLGSRTAQALASRFGLTGRIDLYQVFTRAMVNVLKPGGVLGLLISNRFLTIKAGESLRRLLRTEFQLRKIYDLGDTKLFSAAVLPAIIIATKRNAETLADRCVFDRIYEHTTCGFGSAPRFSTALQALQHRGTQGIVTTETGSVRIERGELAPVETEEGIWTLSTPKYKRWLQTVRDHQKLTFQDVAKIRVGIKTTADAVFVRNDWQQLPPAQRPEPELLHPLITHHDAGRWMVLWSQLQQEVLYPHVVCDGRRAPIDLQRYPRAAEYFSRHAERLKRREYLRNSGRRWYEIWVPHHPALWKEPKIVFPDISETPRFCLDTSGALVQGDCYWMTLKPGLDADWLLLILAVANSTFITKFYDLVYHNKLYSGRRRFVTQFVQNFPLPPLNAMGSRKIVNLVRELIQTQCGAADRENTLNRLVWEAFGVADST
jgi:adenine-specific DNA-methyltransferase